MDDKTNKLANVFLSYLCKQFPKENAEHIWQVSQHLAVMALGKKSFQKFYNSEEARNERNK